MRAALSAVFTLILLSGCEADRTPGPPVPLRSFILHDVQGMHGGCAIWAADDRTATVQVVAPAPTGKSGLWEKRYTLKLTREQWTETERLVGAHHLLSLKIVERPAVPDEAHPIIVVVTKSGTTAKVRKWANDKHPDFDPVYAYLQRLCHAKGELVYDGAFDWKWRPDGFADLLE